MNVTLAEIDRLLAESVAPVADVSDEYKTTAEWAAQMGVSYVHMGRRIKALAAIGKVDVSKRPRAMITGHVRTVPVYRITL